MSRRFFEDSAGLFTCEIEVCGDVLDIAIDHDRAEDVLRSAVIIALSVLAQAGPWPEAYLGCMTEFMLEMREHVIRDELT